MVFFALQLSTKLTKPMPKFGFRKTWRAPSLWSLSVSEHLAVSQWTLSLLSFSSWGDWALNSEQHRISCQLSSKSKFKTIVVPTPKTACAPPSWPETRVWGPRPGSPKMVRPKVGRPLRPLFPSPSVLERVAQSRDYDLFGLVGFNGEKAVPAEHTTCGSGVSARPLRTRCTWRMVESESIRWYRSR